MLMLRDIKRVSLWCWLSLLTGPVLAASLYTETFSDGNTAGWRAQNSFMIVTNITDGGNPGGALRGSFDAYFGIPPPPPLTSIMATGDFNTANFMGDYKEIDAWVMGLDFNAVDILPGDFIVLIYSGSSNVISRELKSYVTQTNTWYSFRLPLLASNLGGWGGDVALFDSIMTNVARIEIRLSRTDLVEFSPAQAYLVDNIFLDRVPEAVLMTDTNQLWLHMRNGAEYRYQAANELPAGSWTDLATFTASNAVYSVTVPATNDWRFYRMLMK